MSESTTSPNFIELSADIVSAYVDQIRLVKTPKSAQTDCYYLRDMFGPICPALEIVSRKPSKKAKKRPPKPGQDRRRVAQRLDARLFAGFRCLFDPAGAAGRGQDRQQTREHTYGHAAVFA